MRDTVNVYAFHLTVPEGAARLDVVTSIVVSHDVPEVMTIAAPDTIMRQRFAELSHRLYLRPEVRVFIADGRSGASL